MKKIYQFAISVLCMTILLTAANAQQAPQQNLPGSFNANYLVNATGAAVPLGVSNNSAALDLTKNPVDTHSIQWRLGSSGLINSVTDAVSYANGDLHTANANWVYTAGTFTVSSNIVYSSAAGVTTAYRSDGPNTANEYAQETMGLISAGSGVQVVGPCVRMATGSSAGYCVDSANDTLRIYVVTAGALAANSLFSADNQAPVTGDIVRIQASGSLISLYKNGLLLGSVTDTTYTTGVTGILGASNATSNGFNNFQSGTLAACNVALENSADGVTWSGTGASATIPVQSCLTPGSFTATQAVSNYVRVNVTSLTAGQTLTVVYSGRLAGAPPSGNNSVNNGIWIQPGQVIWIQYTSVSAQTIVAHQSVRIANGNAPNAITTTTWDIASCSTGPGAGSGTGFTVTQGGWLLSATAEINVAGFPQGIEAVNEYILNFMPPSGGTTSCQATLAASQIGTILGTWPTGSFYPVGFVGTTGQYQHPWSIPGYTTVITQANPAAGAEWLATITANARTCIQSVSFTAAAGSTNITPTLLLKFSIGGNTVNLAYTAATAQTSATTQNYSFSPGASAEVVTATAPIYHIVPFNNGQLACFNGGLTTLTVGTLTTGLNGTTAYTNIGILVQQQNDNN